MNTENVAERIGAANLDYFADFLTAEQVAELLQVSRAWVYRGFSEGWLPGRRLSARVVRFRREDIEAVMSGEWQPDPEVVETKKAEKTSAASPAPRRRGGRPRARY